VRDIGVHGAFLAAAAPIALGTPLRLCLQLGTQRISLGARVARIQEPAWGVTSGWGVAFEHVDAASVRAVEAFVHEALRAAACRSMMRAVAVPDVTCANKRA
jgi:hypothetical protein